MAPGWGWLSRRPSVSQRLDLPKGKSALLCHSPPSPAAAAAPTLPTSPQQLLARLEALGIAYQNHEHAAVFTVEEAKALRGD
jgi:hypothetical protein